MKKLLLLFSFTVLFVAAKGQSLMTVAEIYDYSIGDVYTYHLTGEPPANPGTYKKVTITNKYFSTLLDTVFYVADYYSYSPPACPPPCTGTSSSSTGNFFWYTNLGDTIGVGPTYGIPLTYTTPPCIDTNGYTGTWLDTNYYDSNFCNHWTSVIYYMGNGPVYDSAIACWYYFEGTGGYSKFSRGLGERVSYNNTCVFGFPYCETMTKLIYYKKVTDSCGSPPVIPGVAEDELNNALIVYPNPSGGIFTLDVGGQMLEAGIVDVYNLLGEKIYSASVISRQTSVNLSAQPKGIYFVRVAGQGGSYSQKIVIQ